MSEINVSSMPTDWWAWNGELLEPLGICEDFDDADEEAGKLPYPVNWIFSREALQELRDQIDEELK